MILGPDGLPIAGSANASVGGMMRNVGARQAAMFGEKKSYDYRVQYINPNGSTLAYVDVDVVLDINTEVELEGQIANPSATWNIFYWARSLTDQRETSMCVIKSLTTGRFAKVNPNAAVDITNISYDLNNFVFKTSGRTFYVNGEPHSFSSPDGSSSTVKTLLFCLNQSDGINNIITDSGTRISKMKVSQNGNVIRNMYSVVANNNPTMYDEISGRNMQTYGQILAGPRL